MATCATTQRGFTMLMVMLMMLLATLLVLAGASRSVTQEREAFVMRDMDLAFQAAESALRAGEWFAYGLQPVPAMPVSGCANGLCQPDATGTSPAWQGAGLWSTTSSGSLAVTRTLAEVAQQPRFVVEPLPRATPSEYSSLGIGIGPAAGRMPFRITGYGVGSSPSTTVELQSVYLK